VSARRNCALDAGFPAGLALLVTAMILYICEILF